MKKLLLITLLLSFFSCQKEEYEPDCTTCTLDVVYTSSVSGMQTYVAETREICNDSWQELHGTLDPQSASGTNGGVSWHRSMVWHCK